MSESIQLHRTGGVARITLNRPDKLNAFADDMRERMIDALDRVAGDRDARVLVITGSGRAFCAGGDVRHMVTLKQRGADFHELEPLLAAGRGIITRLDALTIPTIAAVNGPAAGAGMNLALACDVRLASDQATFGETFVRIGLHPDWGGTWFLPRLVGLSRAMELCWSGEVIDAERAREIGLVHRVIPQAQFAAAVDAYVTRLAAAPQASVRLAKRTLRAALNRSLTGALDAEVEAQAVCWRSPDSTEGLAAFVDKREPAFSGVLDHEHAPSEAARHFE